MSRHVGEQSAPAVASGPMLGFGSRPDCDSARLDLRRIALESRRTVPATEPRWPPGAAGGGSSLSGRMRRSRSSDWPDSCRKLLPRLEREYMAESGGPGRRAFQALPTAATEAAAPSAAGPQASAVGGRSAGRQQVHGARGVPAGYRADGSRLLTGTPEH